MRPLFILRPEPGASASAERARRLGLTAVLAPLFQIRSVDWQAPEPGSFDGLLLTSANALRFGGEGLQRLRQLRVYAVGEATAAAARDAGFDIAATGEGGVDALLDSVPPDLKLLHLCGADRKTADGARQEIRAITIYSADPLSRPPELDDLQGAVAAVHSPRAAARLAELVDANIRQCVAVAAISEAAARAAGEGWERLEVAAAPDDEALLALAARLCEEGGG